MANVDFDQAKQYVQSDLGFTLTRKESFSKICDEIDMFNSLPRNVDFSRPRKAAFAWKTLLEKEKMLKN